MKNRIKNDVKEQFLNSLQTIISYPSVLNEGEMEHRLDKLSKMS